MPANPAALQPGAPPASAGARVFVHYSNFREIDRDRAIRLARLLRAQGFQVADLRAVGMSIRSGSVRYFFPDDVARGAAVLQSLKSFYDDESKLGEPPRRAQDLTGYNPKPAAGTIEIWIPTR